MPLWGCVNEGSACTTREAIILFSLARAPPGRTAADRVRKSSAESSPAEPDGEGTGLAVWTSHRRTDRGLVHLRCPSPGGCVEEVAWREDKEETQRVEGKRSGLLLVCSEASVSGHSAAPLTWTFQPEGVPGAVPSQTMAGQVRPLGLQMGGMASASRGEVLPSARKGNLSPFSSA